MKVTGTGVNSFLQSLDSFPWQVPAYIYQVGIMCKRSQIRCKELSENFGMTSMVVITHKKESRKKGSYRT